MTFARRVFLIAGIYGLVALIPQYFLEARNGMDYPPAINHPEYYYGFVGVALAWQVLFLMLSRDPVRYRVMMIPAILEKASFGIATIVLYAIQRTSSFMLVCGLVDLFLGGLFVVSYLKTAKPSSGT